MSEKIANLTPEIRSMREKPRPTGHRAASTADVNRQPATVNQADLQPRVSGGRQADFPVVGEGGPARRDTANHWAWKLQAAMEIKSYVETIAARDVAAGATVTINPSIATVWRLTAAGDVTIEVTDLPAAYVGTVAASRVLSLVLIIQRQAGASITWPAGTMFGLDVLDPDGDGDRSDSLLAPPDTSALDMFVLMKVPMIGWVGTIGALRLSVA